MSSANLVSNANINRLRVNAINSSHTNNLLNIKKGDIFEHYSRQVFMEYKYNLTSNLIGNINKSEIIQTDGKLEITNVTDVNDTLLITFDILDDQLGKYSHNITWTVDKHTGNCKGAGRGPTHVGDRSSVGDFSEDGNKLTIITTYHSKTCTKNTINVWAKTK